MTDPAPFDSLASAYDRSFTCTLTGREQRTRIYRYLESFMMRKEHMTILELNCGTGEDAIWLASWGNRVIATDISKEMISIAKQKRPKESSAGLEFKQMSMCDVAIHFPQNSFDLVFSNFAGINCLMPEEIQAMNEKLSFLLKPQGALCIVAFGKYCIWETAYFALKLKLRKAFRRWQQSAEVELSQGVYQQVSYYSANELQRLFPHFQLVRKRPVGLFVPPSYLEGFIKKHPILWSRLKKWDRRLTCSALAGFGDHIFLMFNKRS